MSKDLSVVDKEHEKREAEMKVKCKQIASQTVVELNYDLSPRNIDKYLREKDYHIDEKRARELAAPPMYLYNLFSDDWYEKRQADINSLSDEELALTKLTLYKFGYSIDAVHNDSLVRDGMEDMLLRRLRDKKLSYRRDGEYFVDTLKELLNEHTKLQQKEDRRIIKKCKHIITVCNFKLFVLFVYWIIRLIAYPLSFGYALSQFHPYLSIVGFICFWIQFEVLSHSSDYLNEKCEEINNEKRTAAFYIANYSSLKEGSPTVNDPFFYR